MPINWDQKFAYEALTFDDVLLIPAFSDVLPSEVDVSTWLTREIRLNIPLVSSAMDTVTEDRMAIALAREGGMGIIHKNMRPEDQAELVRRVKRSESGMISDPITLRPDQTVGEAWSLMGEYHISGVPITSVAGELVGILTNRDLRFEKDPNRQIRDVMTSEDLVTVPAGTTLDEARQALHEHRIEKVLVVDAAGRLAGLITVKDIQKQIEHPHAAKDRFGRLRVGAALGAAPQEMRRAELLVEAGADVLAVDTAHGHSKGVMEAVARVKQAFPTVQIIAGNVSTYDGAMALIEAGADAIKVGQGPGSICTTRVVSGAGMAQVTAIMECARAGEQAGVPIIGDGGIKYSGDVAKALAAGAQCVMIGGLFAGTDEAPGETILYQGRSFRAYRGMGSIGAMQAGSSDRYFQSSTTSARKLVAEGIEGMVPYKGHLSDTVFQLVGGLRSGMGYAGAHTIDELRQTARFSRISAAGLAESHPHDVTITNEAPNYERR